MITWKSYPRFFGEYILLQNSNIPLEHTPDPQLAVYEGNPFIFVFWGTCGMF